MRCPHCNSANTQTYEVIFKKEYKTYSSKRTVSTKSKSISPLGLTVIPPFKKNIKYYGLLLNIVIAICLILIYHVNFSTIENIFLRHKFSFNQFFTIIYATFVLFYTIRTIKRLIYNKKTYPILYKKWQNNWYCHKCGKSFSSEEI